jgi:hypothetical protein
MSSTLTKPTTGNPNLNLLTLVGETIFGSYWQKPMVESIGMSQRHMVRWCQGQWDVPDVLQDGRHLAVVLNELLDRHQQKVNEVRRRVIAAIPEGGRPGT